MGLARLTAMAAQRPAPEPDQRLEFRLWPEHLAVFVLWCSVRTQWRAGMSGPTGLDWCGVRAHPAARQLPRGERERVLADLACMEVAWLAERARLAQAKRAASSSSPFGGLGG